MTLDADMADKAGSDLLGFRAQWHLPLGATQAEPWRRAARVVLLLSTALLLAWAGTLFAQAWQGQMTWYGPMVAAAFGVPCLAMAGFLWRGLGQAAMMPLRWGGLPARRPGRAGHDWPPGWSVPGWPHAVSVHVVFDLGPWLLVKMATTAGPGATLQAWSWVDARVGFSGDAGHHLRALLFNARANGIKVEGESPAQGRGVMASSGDIQRQWSNLLSSFKTIGRDIAQTAVRAEKGARGVVMADSDFARTVILDAVDGPSAGRGRRS